MTAITNYVAKKMRNGEVRYWSVYNQVWQYASDQSEVTDEHLSTLTDRDRELIATLPEAAVVDE